MDEESIYLSYEDLIVDAMDYEICECSSVG